MPASGVAPQGGPGNGVDAAAAENGQPPDDGAAVFALPVALAVNGWACGEVSVAVALHGCEGVASCITKSACRARHA